MADTTTVAAKDSVPDYFTCTLGEAALINERYAVETPEHEYSTVSDFVDYLAATQPDRWALGSAVPPRVRDKSGGAGAVERVQEATEGPIGKETTESAASEHEVAGDGDGRWAVEMLTFLKVGQLTETLRRWLRRCVEERRVSADVDDEAREAVDGQVEKNASSTAKDTVALLVSSSLVSLLVWLGLSRAGYTVLLIAPQCSREAVRHLLLSSKAVAIFFDAKNKSNAQSVFKSDTTAPDRVPLNLVSVRLPWSCLSDIKDLASSASLPDIDDGRPILWRSDEIAFYFHSSGTSSGLPKLISQTHKELVGVLPRLQNIQPTGTPRVGTFTTTPLYHGRSADVFRAWSAASPCWMFPENQAPVSARSILASFLAIQRWGEQSSNNSAVRLGFVSCVPYVLQIMAEETKVLEHLKTMDLVGVGGAALPPGLGDRLVQDHINLVSRFGNTECGFLLSSRRQFKEDQEWNYLRQVPEVESIRFEQLPDGNSELVVTEAWPQISKIIAGKLPFHTCDIFTPHPSILNAWKYVGRSDAQLTLTTGKKFDPSELEEALCVSKYIQDAIVVADDKPYPALLLFLSKSGEELEGDAASSAVWEAVSQSNRSGPAHAYVKRDMIKIFGNSLTSRIHKSSKGTVMRQSVIKTFNQEIADLYSGLSTANGQGRLESYDLNTVIDFIQTIVADHVKDKVVSPNTNFYEAGINSSACMEIRGKLQAQMPKDSKLSLPLNTVYDSETVQGLALSFQRAAQGIGGENASSSAPSVEDEMRAMVEEFANAQPTSLKEAMDCHADYAGDPEHPIHAGKVVLLTGATGSLGVHILDQLIESSDVTCIFLPVRIGPEVPQHLKTRAAHVRLNRSLLAHKLQPLERHRADNNLCTIWCLPITLDPRHMGFDPSLMKVLISSVTHIIHAAWTVNFNIPLSAFAANIRSVVNMYNIAKVASKVKLLQGKPGPCSYTFCSSVASVTSQGGHVPELISEDPHAASPMGYSRSKWVAESILANLAAREWESQADSHPSLFGNETPLPPKVSILRIGQLCGDTEYGVWNMREAWPLLLDAALRIKSGFSANTWPRRYFPDLNQAGCGPLRWLPADLAAKAIIEIAIDAGGSDQESHNNEGIENGSVPATSGSQVGSVKVYHIINAKDRTNWADIQSWLMGRYIKLNLAINHLTIIPAQEWLDRLEMLHSVPHPAKNLIGLWRRNWEGAGQSGAILGTSRAESASPTMRDGQALTMNIELFCKMLAWVLEEGARLGLGGNHAAVP